MSPIPARCPYQAGDRVTRHGWPADPPGTRRRGFTGTVEGYGGGNILDVRLDDGTVVSETWGILDPEQHDIAKATDGYRCLCHRRPWLAHPTIPGARYVPQSDHGPGGIYGPPVAAPDEQLSLFDAARSS